MSLHPYFSFPDRGAIGSLWQLVSPPPPKFPVNNKKVK